MMRLPKKSLEILRKCVSNQNPKLLKILDSEKYYRINQKLGNKLRDAVGDEFVQFGLMNNDEPNEYGLRLEELIDEIGRFFLYEDESEISSREMTEN